MSDRPDPRSDEGPFKLWDHIGVISAVVLGLVVLGFLIVLAAAGYEAALAIIVVLVAGIAFIYLGGRMHGGHGRL